MLLNMPRRSDEAPVAELSGLTFSGTAGGTLWGGNLEQYEEARSTVTVLEEFTSSVTFKMLPDGNSLQAVHGSGTPEALREGDGRRRGLPEGVAAQKGRGAQRGRGRTDGALGHLPSPAGFGNPPSVRLWLSRCALARGPAVLCPAPRTGELAPRGPPTLSALGHIPQAGLPALRHSWAGLGPD